MRSRGYAAALLSAAVLLLAIWVTSTDPIHLLSSNSVSKRASTSARKTPVHQRPAKLPVRPSLSGRSSSTNLGFGIVGYLTLGAVGVALVSFLVGAARHRNRRYKGARLVEAPEVGDAAVALDVPPTLLATAERQLQAIRDGTPRNAIVACWMELEQACDESGLPRWHAETSTEFTSRILARFVTDAPGVDAPGVDAPVGVLAALYREARFSEHRLAETDRDQALSALEHILESLREQHRHQAPRAAFA